MNKFDTLLVNPPVNRLCEVAGNYFPLGLGYIAAVANGLGIKTKIYNAELDTEPHPPATNHRRIENHRLYVAALNNRDLPVWNEYRDVLDRYSPKIIGLSCSSASVGPCLYMAEEAHKRGILTVFGGMHPTIMPEETLLNKHVDFIITGEGEKNFAALCEAVMSGKEPAGIPGVGWKQNGHAVISPSAALESDLESFPFPDRDNLVFADRHSAFLGSMITSRGCPYPCTFCSGEKMHHRLVRYRPVDGVIKELRLLKEKHDVSYVTFYDDFLVSNRKRMVSICEALIAANLGITWGGFSRADSVDPQLLQMMKAAGCIYIGMGVESGSDRTLDKIRKGYKREDAADGVRMVQNAGINVGISMVIGFPFETERDIRDSIDLIEELNVPTNVNTFTPYPGSEIYSECQQRGLISKDGVDWVKTSQHSIYNKFIQDVSPATYGQLLTEMISAADFSTFRHDQSAFDDLTIRRMIEFADPLTLSRITACLDDTKLKQMLDLADKITWERLIAFLDETKLSRMMEHADSKMIRRFTTVLLKEFASRIRLTLFGRKKNE